MMQHLTHTSMGTITFTSAPAQQLIHYMKHSETASTMLCACVYTGCVIVVLIASAL